MKIKSAEFAVSAPDLRSAPTWTLPEVALIGRSNVGKSSLINSLNARRDLARTSNTPGKTQLINFFAINGTWSLVDLPGYGHAQVTKERRFEFNLAVADFLSQRANLRAILVLIDSRLPPQKIDLEFLRWLEGAAVVPYALVFTKTDKQASTKTRAALEVCGKATAAWRATPPDLFVSSSKTGAGRTEILHYLSACIECRDRGLE